MACDLHIHSNVSDGGFTPKEVVNHASEIGLTCIALTDHDTFLGIEDACLYASKTGLSFIPGIEMTSVIDSNEIHILGYFVDAQNTALNTALLKSRQFSLARLTSIIERLTELGYPIVMQEVLAVAGKGSIGRPHVAKVMVQHGYVESIHDAFERFIGSYGPAYIPPQGIPPEDVYQLLRNAGGVPAIAHPGLTGRADMMREDEIANHVEWGALAIEVFHPRHDDYMVSYYMKVAQKFNLGIVGGSDCHGPFYPKILMDRKLVPDWVAEKFKAFYRNLCERHVIVMN
jgi:hypothetical protein